MSHDSSGASTAQVGEGRLSPLSSQPASSSPTADTRSSTHSLSAVQNILSAHTSVLNGLALRLIALDAHAEALSAAAARPATQELPWRGLLPNISASAIFRLSSPIRLLRANAVDGNVSLEELCLLMSLCRQANAQTIFEFGTFDGRTTTNLAANCAAPGRVYTLDLPRHQMRATCLPIDARDTTYIDKLSPGIRYRGAPFADRIVQLQGDSATFDFSPYRGGVDFVFIDASHSYEYVLNDTRAALTLLRGGHGVIAWHDYTSWWGGVVRAIDALYLTEPRLERLRHIEGTALAYAVVG